MAATTTFSSGDASLEAVRTGDAVSLCLTNGQDQAKLTLTTDEVYAVIELLSRAAEKHLAHS